MGRTYTKNIEIFYIDEEGERHPLPYAFYTPKPTFGWTLPEGVTQVSYRFEMRSRYPKNYTVNGEPVFTCAYMSSGLKHSHETQHTAHASIIQRQEGNIVEPIGTWQGTCEVRLRIYDADGNEYTTHEPLGAYSGSYPYDWELAENGQLNKQNRKWDSLNDGYYFCFGSDIVERKNTPNVTLSVGRHFNTGNLSNRYTIQVSDTPLFDEGVMQGGLQTLDGLEADGGDVTAEAVFMEETNGSSLSANVFNLIYGKTYFYRARSVDNGAYSEWSDVNALRVMNNIVPVCRILDVHVPYAVLDEEELGVEGESGIEYLDRPNGEMTVTIRVDDNDTPYVKAWLMFSMPINSQSDALALGVDLNPSVNGVPPGPLAVYNEQNSGKYIRAVTNESLIRIPTNKDIEVTWRTITDRTRSVMSKKKLTNVYLYLFATDGVSTVRSVAYDSGQDGMTIDNSNISDTGTPQTNANTFHVHGDIRWMMVYPVLPDTTQRSLQPTSIESSSSEEYGGSSSKPTGMVGYTDNARCDIAIDGKRIYGTFHSWHDLRNMIENALGYNFLQRTTQNGDFTVSRYKKYAKYYPESVMLTQTNSSKPTYGDKFERGTGNSVTFDYDSNGAESTDSDYVETDTLEGDGFVSFCPYCNELHIVKTVIKLEDGRIFRDTYDENHNFIASAIVNAFGEDGERFDGTPFGLMFLCEGCERLFPMDFRYQTHMASGVYGTFMKENYSYWHGYNSDARVQDNGALQSQLLLTRKKEYELLKEQWKEKWKSEHNNENPKDEDCPYKWVEITGEDGSALMQYGGGTTEASSDNAEYNAERFGLMPEDALLNLNPRPEFDAYMKVVPPTAKSYKEHVYNDGSKLNASIELDYMHDFETKGEGESLEPGDPDLVKLALQGPWWVQNRMMYQFFEGAKSLKSVKDGYPGAPTGNDEEEEEESSGEEHNEEEPTGITEYRVLASAEDGSVATVTTNVNPSDSRDKVTTFFSRMACSGNIEFPLIIKRGVNDRFEYMVNDEIRVAGSMLDENQDEVFIAFPYSDGVEGEIVGNKQTFTCNVKPLEKEKLMKLLRNMLEPVFQLNFGDSDIPFLRTSFQYKLTNGIFETLEFVSKAGTNVNLFDKKLSFTAYGSTSLNVSGLTDRMYKRFELVPCDNSCYLSLGLVPYVTTQYARTFVGGTEYTYDGGVPWLKKGGFPRNPDIQQRDITEETKVEDTGEYWYTERKTTKHEFDVQESPIDNDIEEFVSYTEEREGYSKPFNVKFRKPSTESHGEPLFTCYKDEVDENGYHFKFTPDDYKKTGRIYVRRYHVEMCNPFPMDGYGYRNWLPVPIDGKDGRYRKKQVFSTRGVAAVPKLINVRLTSESPVTQEIGWFPSENENSSPLSHEPESSSSGEQQSQEKIYKRKNDYAWRNDILPKTCVVFDYVDITDALCKNPFTPEGESPLTHVCPINVNFGTFTDETRRRYGMYVLGAYDLTDQQKRLQDDGMPYAQDFTYENDKTHEVTTVTEMLPNNWMPTIIDSVFDTIEGEAETVTVIDTEGKPDSSTSPLDVGYGTKSIDTYARYKKEWEGKVEPEYDPEREFSQQTVEQFSPSFHGTFGIWEKYGYQPKNTLQQYFKVDDDGMYKGKYIPLSSKMVHGIYEDPMTGLRGDPYADYRLIGEIMRERHIISDKSFMKVDDTYDKFPFLDYRIVGKSIFSLLPYFSGYPRDEHPSYATRPEPPYPYDRQWRIGGWRMFERDTFKEDKAKDESFNMEIGAGAQIGELAEFSASNAFLYLQETWNTYNRLHWSLDVGSDAYLCLVAQRIENNQSIGDPFSVKTFNSFWNERLTIGSNRGAWCISYDPSLSDMIDMTENKDEHGNPLFEDGIEYKFELRAFSENNGVISSADLIQSDSFSISPTAVSPATIVSTDYDPWTKILTINFRFDDALGREYDIVGFKYIENDYKLVATDAYDANGAMIYRKEYVPEDSFKVPGGGNGTGVLMGNLLNLASNRHVNGRLSDDLLITHSVQVNVANLGITATANMRVILLSALSIDRMGLTMPEFTVKMWANEFLKPVEEQILSLQGYKSNWRWTETQDETTGKIVGEWKYVDDANAVHTVGRIQETKDKISGISDKFDELYWKSVKFCPEYPNDIDMLETWLKSGKEWNAFYYASFFQSYLADHEGYAEDYEAYAPTSNASLPSTIARKWLQAKNHASEYEAWYQSHRIELLSSYTLTSAQQSKCDAWKNSHRAAGLSEKQIEFARSQMQTDSSSETELSASAALMFIEENNLQDAFISFYAKDNAYADTRFLERALIMDKVFGVTTAGVWNKPYESLYSTAYPTWLAADAAHGSMSLPDRYQAFLEHAKTLVDSSLLSVTNAGRSLAFSHFLQSPAGNGATYSQMWQSLNSTLSQYRKLLVRCQNEKNRLDTEFRRNLVRQGFFGNGFVDNAPYAGNNEVNTCFRWRVETRQYEGKMDTSQDAQSQSYGSYDPRYDMYFHFQMDFFDTFDSQNGESPMLDIIFIEDGETDDCRILAGIDDADNSARTAPTEGDKSESALTVPAKEELMVDKTATERMVAKGNRNIADLQFTAQFGIPKDKLPRANHGTTLPQAWRKAWANDTPWETAPTGAYSETNADYQSAYYWRVAPYNMVERPCYETLLGEIWKENGYIRINSQFHSDSVESCSIPSRVLYYASGSRQTCPIWQENWKSAPIYNTSGNSMYKNDIGWIDRTLEHKGVVQFVTDRPRKSESVQKEVEVQGEAESYLVSNQSGYSQLPDQYLGTYEYVQDGVYESNRSHYLYRATMDGEVQWFIGDSYNSTESSSGSWVYRIAYKYPEYVTFVYNKSGSQLQASIFASYGESHMETVTVPSLSFIDDNLGNFETQWVPASVERRKPFVIRFADQYLMFAHKKVGMAVNGNTAYPQNVITMSRGFSSDVFGEECVCIPKYTFESVGDYVKDGSRKAVSVENPCVVPLGNGIWRMYFNAVFHDGVNYYSKIYKADTVGFADWVDIAEVKIMKGGAEKTDYFQPNVSLWNGTFEMYAASKDHEGSSDTTYTTIKRLSSADGLVFAYEEEIHHSSDNEYNFCSPCLLRHSAEHKTLYITIESKQDERDGSVSCVVGSIDWTSADGWNTTVYCGKSRVVLEKADDLFITSGSNANVQTGIGRIFNGFNVASNSYMNPCVIWDNLNGCRVRRMYYNTYESPMAWSNGSLSSIDGIKELAIKTDYFEEWTWSSVNVSSSQIQSVINGVVKNEGYTPPAASDGSVTLQFEAPNTGNATRFMMNIVPSPKLVRCMAQGEWIDFTNVANTEAILLPEVNNELTYSLSKYSPITWISENDLTSAYNAWLDENRDDTLDAEGNALRWLKETRNFPRYLWWSRKGPGIYRYLGYDVLEDYTWKNSEL